MQQLCYNMHILFYNYLQYVNDISAHVVLVVTIGAIFRQIYKFFNLIGSHVRSPFHYAVAYIGIDLQVPACLFHDPWVAVVRAVSLRLPTISRPCRNSALRATLGSRIVMSGSPHSAATPSLRSKEAAQLHFLPPLGRAELPSQAIGRCRRSAVCEPSAPTIIQCIYKNIFISYRSINRSINRSFYAHELTFLTSYSGINGGCIYMIDFITYRSIDRSINRSFYTHEMTFLTSYSTINGGQWLIFNIC